jgi:hypothetical protein
MTGASISRPWVIEKKPKHLVRAVRSLRMIRVGSIPSLANNGNPAMAVEVPIRPARQQEAAALSELCVRSKEVWGCDAAFMALARAALEVKPEEIAAGNVWVGQDAGGSRRSIRIPKGVGFN